MQRLISMKLASNLPKTLPSSTTTTQSSSLFHFQPHKTFSLTKPPQTQTQNHFLSSFPTHPLHHDHKVHGFLSNPLLRKHFSLGSINTLSRVSSKKLSDCRLAFLQRKTPKQINFQFIPSCNSHLSARRSWYGRMSSNEVLSGLMLANVAVFLLWMIADIEFMIKNFTLSLDGITSGRLHTLITSAFGGLGVKSFAVNLFSLGLFGYNIGRALGPAFLLKLYLAGATGGSVFYLVEYVFQLASKDGDPSKIPYFILGPNGAVFAIMILDLSQPVITSIPAIRYLRMFAVALPIGGFISRIIQGTGCPGNGHEGGTAVALIVWARLRMGLRVF